MTEPFLAEIKIIGFNFAPRGWALCDGQLLPINQNQALYSLLGTNYGGNGVSSFALPDLRGRTPIQTGDFYQLGEKGGYERVSLVASQIAVHTHSLKATTDPANKFSPGPLSSRYLAKDSAGFATYVDKSASSSVTMSAASIGTAGSGQSHNNMQPTLVLNYCIALTGLFPPRN